MSPLANQKLGDDRTEQTLSIGQVIDLLRPDFADVTISKVRFLENEGLVTPERTASGYRRFSSIDVDRLRYILAAQKDRYLPLKVIRAELDELDAGLADGRAVALPKRSSESVPGAEPADFRPLAPIRLTAEMVAKSADISLQMVQELHAAGLLDTGRSGFFEPEAVIIARTAKELASHGVDVRHLRPFRAAAARQADLISAIAAPVAGKKDLDAKARAAELVREIAALTVTLHATLVTVSVRRELDS